MSVNNKWQHVSLNIMQEHTWFGLLGYSISSHVTTNIHSATNVVWNRLAISVESVAKLLSASALPLLYC